MASEGNGFTHYVVSKEVVLGEACVVENAASGSRLHSSSSESTGPEAVIERAFIENQALVPKTAN